MERHCFKTSVFLLLLFTAAATRAQQLFESFENCTENVYGFIDIAGSAGNIPPVYCAARGFSEGLAAVKKGPKWGFINAKNEQVIPFKFDLGSFFKKGQAIVKDSNLYGVINRKGEYVVPPVYYDLQQMEIGGEVYYISRDASFFQGIIDAGGKIVLPHRYTYVLELAGYENVPFYAAFQEVDTSSISFYDQFAENSYKFGPEKGRHDIFDTGFNKLASKQSTGYDEGFQHYQLQRVDKFLETKSDDPAYTPGSKAFNTEIRRLVSMPGPRPEDAIPNTTYMQYKPKDEQAVRRYLDSLGYRIFKGGDGKYGLKKGDRLIIPAVYSYLKPETGIITDMPEGETGDLQKNYAGGYRNKEKKIFEFFCIIGGNNTSVEVNLFDLRGNRIITMSNKGGVRKALSRATPLGFTYLLVVEDASGGSRRTKGLVNWRGKELFAPDYEKIAVLRDGLLLLTKATQAGGEDQKQMGLYTENGKAVIPMGKYSKIQPLGDRANLFLASQTAEGRDKENRRYVQLKVKGNSCSVVNQWTASMVSVWAVDDETGMLPYQMLLE